MPTAEPISDPPVSTELRLARSLAEREAIYRFRYQIYVQEMGKHLSYADSERQILYDEMDADADHFMVLAAGEVVAAARLNQLGRTPLSDYWRQIYGLQHWQGFRPDCLSISSRLMVASAWRGSAVLAGLLLRLFEHARARGVRFNFLNCAPSLLGFYEQLGYRRYTQGFVDEDVGYRIPMVFITEDANYMRRVRSPFWRLARKLPTSDADSLWFEGCFPNHATHLNKRLLDSEEFWDILEHNLHADPTQGIPLLAGLSEAQAQAFLGSCSLLSCQAGELIIRPGDVGDELFVVLEGVVEIWGGSAARPISLALLGPGELFGEIAFVSRSPRTARVQANTEVKLLILTQALLNKAMKTMPEIVARVLLNLSVVLCDRLRGSTQNWVNAVQAVEGQGHDRH
ncbi:MAG: cyclic nucleotide-binding domain-containing protein [Gammaproteobacteria bacterium SHHR-1]|uniref:cyclic nucleotide-binding domain-containing protein n=1 Tax=Magnetovirga frankeli TaxID=947516 RepID=UPI001AF94AD1|nr:cyclic nucleotide-binding domain-containing protein [gamma proteobacterium SS-5]